MKRTTKFIMPAVVIVIGAILMFTLLGMKSEVTRRTPKPRPKVVSTLIAAPRTIGTHITAMGKVASAQPVDIYSEVTGVLQSGDIPFLPAQSFKKGDLLLKVDDRQIKLDIKSAKSDLISALAVVTAEIKTDFPDEYSVWRDYLDNIKFGQPLAQLPDINNQRIRMILSRLNVYRHYFKVNDLEIMLEKHYIYAPFDGSIVIADMRVGSTTRNGTHLGQIINLEDLEVELPVPTTEIPWFNIGADVKLTSKEMKAVWNGKVARIGRNIDPRTQTIPVYVTVNPNSDIPLYDGIFLEAEIYGSSLENALIIPRHAVYDDDIIYCIDDGKLQPHTINILRAEKDSVLITGGIDTGDTIVVDLMQGIVPGMPAVSRGSMK